MEIHDRKKRKITQWVVQTGEEEVNLEEQYGHSTEKISFKFHPGGEFTDPTQVNLMYVKRKFNYIDEVNSNYFSIITLYDMLVELGYYQDNEFRFYYRLPWEGLGLGLRQLLNDNNVHVLNKIAETEKSIDIYVEHIDYDYDALKNRLVFHQLLYEQVWQQVEDDPFEQVKKEVEYGDPIPDIDPDVLKQAFDYRNTKTDDDWYHDPYEGEYDPLYSPYCLDDDCHWK